MWHASDFAPTSLVWKNNKCDKSLRNYATNNRHCYHSYEINLIVSHLECQMCQWHNIPNGKLLKCRYCQELYASHHKHQWTSTPQLMKSHHSSRPQVGDIYNNEHQRVRQRISKEETLTFSKIILSQNHYENTPIQIYRHFYLQKVKLFR